LFCSGHKFRLIPFRFQRTTRRQGGGNGSVLYIRWRSRRRNQQS